MTLEIYLNYIQTHILISVPIKNRLPPLFHRRTVSQSSIAVKRKERPVASDRPLLDGNRLYMSYKMKQRDSLVPLTGYEPITVGLELHPRFGQSHNQRTIIRSNSVRQFFYLSI